MTKLRLNLKSAFIIALILFCVHNGFAQFSSAEIGVDGLTCSACTRAVEMSILKLNFVNDVQMNLENTTGKIIFKKGAEVNLKKIAKAITDAGFSVRYLKATYSFSNSDISTSGSLLNASGEFCFVIEESKKLNGDILLTIISKEFMPKKEYNKWKELIRKHCGEIKKEIYYVTTKLSDDK
ncbi:MAG: heavy-metal-associated domain-containing protein [Bacteroidetes bacterium]|nr:heavy-metal-associated domain-containing protein [Bacteroidota bacterium]